MVQFLDTARPQESTDHHDLLDSLHRWTGTEAKSPEAESPEAKSPEAEARQVVYRRQIVWLPNALGFLFLHIVGVYAIYLGFTQAQVKTLFWTIFTMALSGLGVTMGAHRLYSHKAFKAKAGLRLVLVMLQTLAGQNCMYIWVRDHRQHHKYSDTDGDPHNASRGFFFSHIGWLMCRKHPDVISKGKTIDMSDLEADPFVMFQKKYYKTLYALLAVGVPTLVPVWLWGEDPFISLMTSYLARTIISLNLTWLVNSAAHKFGNRPYTKDILPVEQKWVSFFGLGEGWHNYHHTFPWDYRAAELGHKWNLTRVLLDTFHDWGWVYDLRYATPAMVQHRVARRGDGSHPLATALPDDTELPSERLTRRPGL